MRLPEFGPSAAQPLEPVRASDYSGGRWLIAIFFVSAAFLVSMGYAAIRWGAV